MNIVAIGCQLGDEGKGKIVDFLSDKADFVVRFNGGGNAGHTLKIEGKKLVLHYIPSGIPRKKTCVIGHGCVVSLDAIRKEMQDVRDFGVEPLDFLKISKGAHLVLPEEKEGISASTGRGIAPTYKNKYAREGLRAWDLIHAQNMEGDEKRPLFKQYHEYLKSHEDLIPLLIETPILIHKAIEENKNILFEGAQGVSLGIDYGQYPYVTSSCPGIAGAFTGAGINHKNINKVIGITKAYVTRAVDTLAPMKTEMDEETSTKIRKIGNEYGATTGIPRRVGWLNIPELKLAIKLNGLDGIALTKMDIFDDFDKIKICTSYTLDGKETDEHPCDGHIQKKCEPIYIEVEGWKQSIQSVTDYEQLPDKAKEFIKKVEELLKIPVILIGTGPGREEIICREDIWK